MADPSPETNGNGKLKFFERVLTSQGPAAVIALACVGTGVAMLIGWVETPWAGLKEHIVNMTQIHADLKQVHERQAAQDEKMLGLAWASCHNTAKNPRQEEQCDRFYLPFSR